MRVTERSFDVRLPRSHGRSEGLHLSEVLRHLAFQTGVLDIRYDVEDMDELLMGIGMAVEDWLISTQHPEVIGQPGEVEKDGIYMTPDGLSLLDGDASLFSLREDTSLDSGDVNVLNEIKFTKKSSRDFVEHLRMRSKKAMLYLWQIMAYCYALGTHLAILRIVFINGNYSRTEENGSRARYMLYYFHFSDEDLEENWQMVLNHAAEMRGNK